MRISHTKRTILALTGFIGIAMYPATAALAQDASVQIGDLMMQQAVSSSMMSAARASTGRAGGVRQGITKPEPSARSLTYTTSVQRRRSNYAQFVERSRRVDPAGADKLAATLANDPVSSIGHELAHYGLHIDNVADAYAAWWMSAWQAAHDDTSDPSRATARAVSDQAAHAILATPEFRVADDAKKQEFAEALLVQAGMISAAQAKYRNDPAMLRRLASSVRQGARASGVDLDAMILTDHGFIPADRTGAADPAPGTERHALAADGRSGDHPSYGLLAAAGGAGLGAALLIGRAMGRKG